MHVKFQLVREKEGLWEDKSRAVAEAQAAALQSSSNLFG